VRKASANVVSIIAKYAVPAGEWPDLLPFLFQCSQSAQEDHREVRAIFFFSSLLYLVDSAMQEYPDQAFLSMILLTIRSACAIFFPLSDNLRVSAGFTRIERVAY
jgi:hypothetical protein